MPLQSTSQNLQIHFYLFGDQVPWTLLTWLRTHYADHCYAHVYRDVIKYITHFKTAKRTLIISFKVIQVTKWLNIDGTVRCWIEYSWELQTRWFQRLFGAFYFSVAHTSIFQIWERTVLNVLLHLDISSDVALSIIAVTNMGVAFYP